MFINLTFAVPTFAQHNFSLLQGQLRKEPDPSWDVEDALRSSFSYVPGLVETLSHTLSPECYASFIRANPELPITERDYFLSKLFQFFYQSLLDEADNAPHWHTARETLEGLLDGAFPEASPNPWADLSKLDWPRFFRGYRDSSLESLVANIASYIPTQATPSKPSPAQVIDSLRKERDWTMEQLAHEAGMNIKQLNAVKNGKGVHTDSVKKIARALGCDPGDLLTL